MRAVLFAKDLERVAAFYSAALGMKVMSSDEHHTQLESAGFTLIVHRIPKDIADGIVIERPPRRRVGGAIRLDYPVRSIAQSREAARSLGGDIDDQPPAWAGPGTNLYFGHDPEGNQFGVSEQA